MRLNSPTPRRPKPTTIRLEPNVQAGLVVLADLLKKPLNRLVNEAVQLFIKERSQEVEDDLENALKRLRAVREKDPDFELAIASFAEAEASLSGNDPVEGTLVDDETASTAGPVQTKVHELLRG